MEYRKVTKDECVEALQLFNYSKKYDLTYPVCNYDLLTIVSCYWFNSVCKIDMLNKIHAAYEINSEIINKSEKEKNGNQI